MGKRRARFRDRIKELRRVKAGDLRANPKNWRTHPSAQKKALEAVLGQIGLAEAVVAYEEADGGLTLIDGHLRQSLDPEQLLPVLVLDVTAAEADVLLATLDPLSEMARGDSDRLSELLGGLQAGLGPELDAKLGEIRDRYAVAVGPTTRAADPDEETVAEDAPVSSAGSLWALGRHRLLCGDSTDGKQVERLLEGARPVQMVTDPPYGVSYEADWRHEVGLNNSAQVGRVRNDDRASWAEAWQHFPGDVAYVWHASLQTPTVQRSLELAGFVARAVIIWVKRRAVIGRGAYHWAHEPCLYCVREGATAQWAGGRKQTTTWANIADSLPTFDESIYARKVDETTVGLYPAASTTVWELGVDKAAGGGHSTQKPVETMARPMRHHFTKGAIVYEPFCGSGTALIAAEIEGRVCYAMELDPGYVDAAVKRWEKFTNRKADRLA